MAKPEIKVECNEGTKYKVVFDKKNEYYVLYYRNDKTPLLSVTGNKIKKQWLYLDSQANYSDILAFLYDEIASKDAVEGA